MSLEHVNLLYIEEAQAYLRALDDNDSVTKALTLNIFIFTIMSLENHTIEPPNQLDMLFFIRIMHEWSKRHQAIQQILDGTIKLPID